MDPASRTNEIYGTIALGDRTAPATKLSDTMTLGYAYSGNITVGAALLLRIRARVMDPTRA